jgi:tRNA threonylcarbamoyladenosine biosynthesis protein TsaB
MTDDALIERHEVAPRRHAELLLPWCDQLLAEAGIGRHQLDAVAYGRGPGAFTGLRIACSVVQGIAFALNRPVIPVSTLEALAVTAWQVEGGALWLSAIDARMGELYWSGWSIDDDGVASPVIEEQLVSGEQAPLPTDGQWRGCGSGWLAEGERLGERVGTHLLASHPDLTPRSGVVATIAARQFASGGGLPASEALPEYLRNRVAWQKTGASPSSPLPSG